jgi:hypothetical protein
VHLLHPQPEATPCRDDERTTRYLIVAHNLYLLLRVLRRLIPRYTGRLSYYAFLCESQSLAEVKASMMRSHSTGLLSSPCVCLVDYFDFQSWCGSGRDSVMIMVVVFSGLQAQGLPLIEFLDLIYIHTVALLGRTENWSIARLLPTHITSTEKTQTCPGWASNPWSQRPSGRINTRFCPRGRCDRRRLWHWSKNLLPRHCFDPRRTMNRIN